MPRFSCQLLSKDEYERVLVPFDDVEDRIHPVMEEFGYCIVTDVFSSEEVKAAEALLNEDLIDLVDVDQMSKMAVKTKAVFQKAKENGISEWPLQTLQDCSLSPGFLCSRGLAHSSFAWTCRFRARKIYEILHRTKDLVSSFDTIMATNNRDIETKYNSCWPHVDRSDSDPRVPNLKNWEVYQSILYLWSSEYSHASTTVV